MSTALPALPMPPSDMPTRNVSSFIWSLFRLLFRPVWLCCLAARLAVASSSAPPVFLSPSAWAERLEGSAQELGSRFIACDNLNVIRQRGVWRGGVACRWRKPVGPGWLDTEEGYRDAAAREIELGRKEALKKEQADSRRARRLLRRSMYSTVGDAEPVRVVSVSSYLVLISM